MSKPNQTPQHDLARSLGRMRRKVDVRFSEAFVAEHGRQASVALQDVATLEAAFQVRGGRFRDGVLDEYLVDQLQRVLPLKDLDPVLVWRAKDRWYLLDGHHRLEAYKRANRTSLPAVIFDGSATEAMREAGVDNAKVRRGMSITEKNNRAWEITRAEPADERTSAKQIAADTGLSLRQIRYMRSVWSKMTDQDEDPEQFRTWKHAHAWAQRIEYDNEEDRDAAMAAKREADISRHTEKLRQSLGASLYHDPEMAEEVLSRFFGGRWPEIMEQAGYVLRDADADEDQPQGPDF